MKKVKKRTDKRVKRTEKKKKPVNLRSRDNQHNNSHEDGVVTIPKHIKLK